MAARRTAALLLAAAASAEAGLAVKAFGKYPGYGGALTVEGSALVGQALGNKVILDYSFTGGDTACAGTDNGKANTCGVHIHTATSCTTSADVGGHYFSSKVQDPWGAVQYTNVGGTATGTNVVVEAATTLAENKGKAVVVHDADGTRIACGMLVEDTQTTGTLPVYAQSFAKYPGYTGSLAVSGSVTMMQTAAAQGTAKALVLGYSLEGTDPKCLSDATRTAANACGIHVHTGNCSDAQGHYYSGSSDPWAHVEYFADAAGKTGTSVTAQIPADKTTLDLVGRSFVVHDLTGARIGCSDISDKQTVKVSLISGAPSRSPWSRLLAAAGLAAAAAAGAL